MRGDPTLEHPPLARPSALIASTGVVLVLNLLLRATNLLQQTALAAVFGPGPELDAYATAVSLPNLLISLLILGPLGLALTPVLAAAPSGPAHDRTWQVVSTTFCLVALVALPLTALGMALAPGLVRALAPGLPDETAAEATLLLRILFPAVGCAALAAVLRSILHGLREFAAPLAAYVSAGLLLLTVTVTLGARWGITTLAWTTLAGAVLGLAGQGWFLQRQGAHLRCTLDLSLPELRSLGRLLLGTSLALAATQLVWVWDRVVASYLGPGHVALLDFALNADKLVGGTIAFSVATVSYPALVAARLEPLPALGHAAAQMLRRIALFTFPAVGGLLALREPLLRVWLQHGHFAPDDTATVAMTLTVLGPALIASAFTLPLLMTFHALGKLRTAIVLCLVGLLGHTVAASAGAASFGLSGIAAGTSLATAATAFSLGFLLPATIPGFPARPLLGALAAYGLAALLAGALAQITLLLLTIAGLGLGLLPDLVRLAASGGVFVGSFLLLLLWLRGTEVRTLLTALRRT